MNNEWKVCTLEQAKRLVELGVVLETEHLWDNKSNPLNPVVKLIKTECIHYRKDIYKDYIYPAPDAAELWELLPYYDLLTVQKEAPSQYCWYYYDSYSGVRGSGGGVTEAQALCDALIWLIENGYFKMKG